MPNYLHRTTKQYSRSVSPVDLVEPAANYIQDPDISAVEGQPNKYWVITGDVVTLASAGEQTAIDAALDAAGIQNEKDSATSQTDTNRLLLGFMETMVGEINILRQAASITPARTLDDYKTNTKNNIENQS